MDRKHLDYDDANDTNNDNDDYQPWNKKDGPEINFSGINWDEHEEQRFEGGRLPAPEPGTHVLRVDEVKTGIQQKGQGAKAPYFMCKCMVIADDGESEAEGVWQFCGMSTTPSEKGYKQISSTKAFIKDIGRIEMFEPGTEMTAQDLVGTEFQADVYLRVNDKGEEEGRLKNISPISHKVADAPKAKAKAGGPRKPTPAPDPSPARPPQRGGRQIAR